MNYDVVNKDLIREVEREEQLKTAAEILEKTPWLHDLDKVGIFLAAAGVKAATMIGPADFFPDSEPDFRGYVTAQREQFDSLLDQLPVKYIRAERLNEPDEDYPERRYSQAYFISSEEKNIEELRLSFREGFTKKDKLGVALGFPKTAAEAYARGTHAKREEIPQEVRETPEFKLLFFSPSKLHWSEELKWMREEVVPLIKKYFPRIFADVMKNGRISIDRKS